MVIAVDFGFGTEKTGLVVEFPLVRGEQRIAAIFAIADDDCAVPDLKESAAHFAPDGKDNREIELGFRTLILFGKFFFLLADGPDHEVAEA